MSVLSECILCCLYAAKVHKHNTVRYCFGFGWPPSLSDRLLLAHMQSITHIQSMIWSLAFRMPSFAIFFWFCFVFHLIFLSRWKCQVTPPLKQWAVSTHLSIIIIIRCRWLHMFSHLSSHIAAPVRWSSAFCRRLLLQLHYIAHIYNHHMHICSASPHSLVFIRISPFSCSVCCCCIRWPAQRVCNIHTHTRSTFSYMMITNI